MDKATADLCDAHPKDASVVEPGFRAFGARRSFSGPCSTVACFEDNVLVRAALETAGEGRVLVVDGGGSLRCALLGDRLATLARDHGWAGVIVHGCIRDSGEIGSMDVGIRALDTHPRKSEKRGEGERDVPVSFAGVTFHPGDWVYVDADGIVVAVRPLN